ncbi:MAG TPA: ABC transporter permease [Cytophagales bacterium]|nr:ABC transporter permease [Cytophagales bacterium]
MFDIDKWQEIWATMQKNKLRTFLTAFGVFWGIFMLVLLLGVGTGMQNGIYSEFGDQAINNLWIWDGRTSIPYKGMQPGRTIRFTNQDIEAIKNEIKEVDLISPRNGLWGEYTINYKDKNGSYIVFGANYQFFKVNGEKLGRGRMLNLNDMVEKRKVVIIGEKVSKVLFGDANPVGEYVNIRGIYFKVVGTFTNTGNNGRNEERLYAPFSTFQATFNQINQVQNFTVTTDNTISAAELGKKIKEVLATRHNFSPDDPQAIGMYNNEENFQRFTSLFTGIKIFVFVVGIFTLIAGVIGVSNIMLIIVKERTREIGIRKAIGATPFSIVSLIIMESVIITGLSGYFGLIAGTGLLDLIRYGIEKSGAQLPYFTRPEVDLWIALVATGILILSGALAGLVPALKAARIKPIEALMAD